MSKLIALTAAVMALAFGCATTKTESVQEKKSAIFFNAGTESLMQKDYTGALRNLQEAVKYDPKSAPAWTNLGLAYLAKGERGRAEESFKKALESNVKWTDARANLGALYMQQKRFSEAETQLKEAQKDLIYPRMHLVHFNLATIYGEMRKPLLVEQHLKLALQAHDGYCPAWFRLGLIQKDRGEVESAAASFTKATAGTCFQNPQAHYEIGTLLIKAREVSKAKAKFLEVIQFFPDSEWAKKAEVTLNMIR